MDIQGCKKCIEENTPIHSLIIFKDNGSNFISRQYMHAIAKVNGMEIEFIDTLDSMLNDLDSIFFEEGLREGARFNVHVIDKFLYRDERIKNLDNLCIICNNIDEESEKIFKEYIIEVPKLEAWQIKDYVYSLAEGVPAQALDKMISLCGNNIDRLDSELSKLALFNENERKYLLDAMIQDGAFSDLTDHSVFNVTNAILRKNFDELKEYVKEFGTIDINEIGLVTILAKNFRNIISVHLNNNPTPDNTGLDSKQIYAIKKIPKLYSPDQLKSIYTFLCDVDKKLKTGELPIDMMINYVMCKVLTL